MRSAGSAMLLSPPPITAIVGMCGRGGAGGGGSVAPPPAAAVRLRFGGLRGGEFLRRLHFRRAAAGPPASVVDRLVAARSAVEASVTCCTVCTLTLCAAAGVRILRGRLLRLRQEDSLASQYGRTARQSLSSRPYGRDLLASWSRGWVWSRADRCARSTRRTEVLLQEQNAVPEGVRAACAAEQQDRGDRERRRRTRTRRGARLASAAPADTRTAPASAPAGRGAGDVRGGDCSPDTGVFCRPWSPRRATSWSAA